MRGFFSFQFKVIVILVSIVLVSCNAQFGFQNQNGNNRADTGRINQANPTGHCQEGKIYTILEGINLSQKSFESELECLYEVGVSPSKVPEGALYGTLLSILNTKLFNSFVNRVWWGKITQQYYCPNNGPIVHIGWNNMLNHFLNPFLTSLGHLEDTSGSGIGKAALILDYSVDFSQICPGLEQFVGKRKNAFPSDEFVDGIRLVGRQKDGGAILLGKVVHKNDRKTPLVYFYFVNYDSGLNPEFIAGQAIPENSLLHQQNSPLLNPSVVSSEPNMVLPVINNNHN